MAGVALGAVMGLFSLVVASLLVEVLTGTDRARLTAVTAAVVMAVGSWGVLSMLRGRRDLRRAIASLDEPARTDVAGPPGQAATPPVSGPWSREAARRTVPQQPTREDRP